MLQFNYAIDCRIDLIANPVKFNYIRFKSHLPININLNELLSGL